MSCHIKLEHLFLTGGRVKNVFTAIVIAGDRPSGLDSG